MGKVAGKDTVFWLDNSAGTLVNLTTFTDNCDLDRKVALLDVTQFGDAGEKAIPGLQGDSFSVSGAYDGAAAAIDAHLSGIYAHANTQTFEYGPEGGTTGKVKYSGECRLEGYKVTSTVKGRVEWSASLKVDGVVTRGTFA